LVSVNIFRVENIGFYTRLILGVKVSFLFRKNTEWRQKEIEGFGSWKSVLPTINFGLFKVFFEQYGLNYSQKRK